MFSKWTKVSVVAALLFIASAAFADLSLDDAKSNGLVGEDSGGYVAAVGSASREVRALVNDINDKRRAEYERIAAANNINLSDVEQLAGKKAIERTAPGGYIRLPGSDWQKK